MTEIWIILAGFGFFVLGLGHKLEQFKAIDERLCQVIYQRLNHPILKRLFQLLWPLGTTPFTIIALLFFTFLLILLGTGLSLIFIWVFAAIFERVIKVIINRQRPFQAFQGVENKQPRPPKDPSFPSGDAMRIWYVCMLFIFVLGPTWYSISIALITAALVSLGRIAMGVHYPLDVLAGSGLGLMAYGIWQFIYW